MNHVSVLISTVGLLGAAHAQTQTAEALQHDLLKVVPKLVQASDGYTPAFYVPKGVASNYCIPLANSFGTIVKIEHMGSLNLLDKTFGLSVSGAPPAPQSLGMFTFGKQQAFVPFSSGMLCISPGSMNRFPIQSLTKSGIVSLSMTSHPKDFAPFTGGSSWNFQFWYRNPAGAGAGVDTLNMSNGLHVQFAP